MAFALSLYQFHELLRSMGMGRAVFLLLSCFIHLAAMAQDEAFSVYAERSTTLVTFYADNQEVFPQSVSLDMDLKGLKSKDDLEEYYVVAPKAQKQKLFELVIPRNRAWSYDFRYQYFMGDVLNAFHDDDYVYMFPFEAGERFRLGQGYNGRFSHQGENALDFNMPVGTPIVAARPGKVVRIKEDSDTGCPDRSCARLGNYITIMHEDGSFSEYYHLQKEGALVDLEEQVERGQVIGKSGNTGWSSGPHLHFVVFLREMKSRKTLRTQFKTESGAIYVEEETTYTSVH